MASSSENGRSGVVRADEVPPFKDYVLQYMEREGLNKAGLARLLGVHSATVILWSQGRPCEARHAIRFAKLAGLDERIALAAAGHWPPELPIVAPGSAAVAVPAGLEDAVRDARRVRPDIDERELADLLRYWVRIPDGERALLFEIIQKHGGRIRRDGDKESA